MADVVGYSHMMGRDEAGTLAALRKLRREVIDPHLQKHGGRLVKEMGNGLLVEFASSVSAVSCAAELQGAISAAVAAAPEDQRFTYRMGMNVGDVIVEGADVLGDAVNVAARLEIMAQPGTIYMSQAVYDDVRAKLPLCFEDLGEHQLKNIIRLVRVYRLMPRPAAP